MNKVDNQGARYEAVASVIHAAEILIRYEKGSEHDGSEDASENADEMLQTALKVSSHVLHLQTFKTKPIPYPKLPEIVPGSEEEARYIWLLLSGGSQG